MRSEPRPAHALPHVTAVGIGADGWSELPKSARELVLAADVVFGGHRHLDLVPDVPGQQRLSWPQPLTDLDSILAEHAGQRVVALASGDPFVSGIGTNLARILGDQLDVLPAISSVSLARARLHWPAESTHVVTLVARDPDQLRRELAPGRRILVLSSDETTPPMIAKLLTDEGYGTSRLTVLGDLGSSAESRMEGRADDADTWVHDLPRLHILAIEVSGAGHNSWAPGLADDLFDHDGQLTKRDLRASALARLEPRPGQLLWDVGAGAGSVAIEWLRAHRGTTAVAIEAKPERAERIGRNARHLGVPHLTVVAGHAPDVFADLPQPHAIFVGGGATAPGLLDRCRAALAPGGRLVVHGVTFETEQTVLAAYQRHGGELTRISVEHATPLGRGFTSWQPARAVVQWAWNKATDEGDRR